MRLLFLLLIVLIFNSCNVVSFRFHSAGEILAEKGYKLKEKEGRVYAFLYKRKASKGDLSLLCRWKPIIHLELEDVVFEPNYFFSAAECTTVQSLSITTCENLNMANLTRFPSLSDIGMGGKSCSDESVNHVSRIKDLNYLLVAMSPITSMAVKHLAENAKKIEVLVLEDTDIDDSVFPYLLQMPHLREVSLRRTLVTREAASKFRRDYRKRYGRQIYLYTQQRSVPETGRFLKDHRPEGGALSSTRRTQCGAL